ncbi:CdiA C-terminal domain-containing protein [Paractinoplanes durhamensis]|uniref:CdiA C-terminal domain-containing protein n=1 Tax=Paractinoplanes durhamensis TaxID=113563 RepID=UPI001944AC8E|nr:hypothetical protein [Actinoplanes durhamensis]
MTRRSLELENEGAVTLAAQGYRVHRNPSLAEAVRARQATGDVGRPESEPDYLVEGRVFDCSAPGAGTSVRNVWSGVRKKVRKRQAQRVVVHLGDWDGDIAELRQQFDDWPIADLKEVKAILPDGSVIQIDLPRESE